MQCRVMQNVRTESVSQSLEMDIPGVPLQLQPLRRSGHFVAVAGEVSKVCTRFSHTPTAM